MTPTIWIEILKLTAQFSGALVITWLAVCWALRRYKSEKLWERSHPPASQLETFIHYGSALRRLVSD